MLSHLLKQYLCQNLKKPCWQVYPVVLRQLVAFWLLIAVNLSKEHLTHHQMKSSC